MNKRTAFQLRVPADVKAWMEIQANQDHCSQNSAVIRALRAAMTRSASYEVGQGETAEEFAETSPASQPPMP